MKKIVFFLVVVLVIFVSGCRTVKPTTPVAKAKDSIVYVEKLVPVSLPADSAYIEALFECDSTNQVIMKELTETKTKRVNTTTAFKAGKTASLAYRAKTIHDTIYAKQIQSLKYKEVPVPYPEIKEVNVLHWWQKVLMWEGVVFTILLLIAIYRKIKPFMKI
jgi:hypothetical protein